MTKTQLNEVIKQCEDVLSNIATREDTCEKSKSWNNSQARYFEKMKLSAMYYLNNYGLVYYNENEVMKHYKLVFN